MENDFFNFGIAITNLGDKISYNFNQKELLPTNIGIGSTYIRKLKGNSSISLSLDINKLLVPSPQPVLDSQGQIIGQFVPEINYTKASQIVDIGCSKCRIVG